MSDQKRQHPIMIPLGAVRSLLYLLPPLVIVMIQNIGNTDSRWTLVTFAIFAAVSLAIILPYQMLNWAFYTYRYESGYLHIKSGVVFKKERSIKQERVQTVNIRTGILQRLLGLASLHVETAGGGMESELSLTAVTIDEARKIKETLESSAHKLEKEKETAETGEEKVANEAASGSEAETFEEVYRISSPELFLAGATSGRFLLLFSLIAAVFSQVMPFIPETFWENMIEQVTSTAAATVVLVLIVLLLFSWFISALAFMIQNANFTVRRQKESLQVSWGLIEQKQLTLKLHRLQALGIHEGVLRQLTGRCALIAEVAGGGSREQNYVTVLFPLLRSTEVANFLVRILPEYQLPRTIVPLPLRARRRYIFRALLTTLPVIIPLQWAPYGWIAFILVIPAYFWGLSRYNAGGTVIEDLQLTLRFRFINRYKILVRRNYIQALEVSSNPLQRWWNLRTVQASVLSSPAGKSFKVTDLDIKEARNLWKWYSRS